MKKLVLYAGLLSSIVTIATFFGLSSSTVAESDTIGINGSNNINNTVVQNAEGINLNVGYGSVPQYKCGSNETYIASTGYYGAINEDIFMVMRQAISNNQKRKIEELLLNGQVIKFDGGEIVCLEKEAFYNYRKKVFVPTKQLAYWVPDEAITKAE